MAGPGVARDVGQGLPDDAVGGDLDRGREVGDVTGHLDGHPEAGRDGGGLAADGTGEPDLVQCGRPQAVHEAPHLGEHPADVGPGRGQRRVGGREVAAGLDAGGVDPTRDGGERRAEAVVQVAAQPAALVLHRRDEQLAAALQLVGQPRGTGGGRRLTDDVGEQPLVGRAQTRRGTALRQEEPPDRLAAVRDGQGSGDLRARAVLDHEHLPATLAHLDADVREAEGRGERAGHLEELLVGRRGVFQAAREGGHHGVRVVTLPHHPSAHDTREAVSQWDVDGEHDDDGDGERLTAVERGVEEPRGAPEDDQVEHDRAHDQRTVDDRVAEQPVDVDQLGLGDADRDRGRRDGDGHDQPGRRPRPGQHPDAEHHEDVDDAGPQQPAHPGSLEPGRGAQPVHDHGDGRHEAHGEQEVGRPQQAGVDGIREGKGHHIEVEPLHRPRQRTVTRSRLRDASRHREEDDGQQGGGPERGDCGDAPAARRQPAVREEDEEQGQQQEEAGAEPLVDHEGERRALQGRLRVGREAEPRGGEAVEGPPDAEPGEKPAHQVPWVVGQHGRAGPGHDEGGDAGGPGRFQLEGQAVGCRHLEVDQDRRSAQGCGDGEHDRPRSNGTTVGGGGCGGLRSHAHRVPHMASRCLGSGVPVVPGHRR